MSDQLSFGETILLLFISLRKYLQRPLLGLLSAGTSGCKTITKEKKTRVQKRRWARLHNALCSHYALCALCAWNSSRCAQCHNEFF